MFPSVSLCPMNPVNGGPDLSNPLVTQAPFSGSVNGVNTVPINLTVNSAGQTYFWVMRFPSRGSTIPPNFPFVRMDFTQLDRGLFANLYTVTLAGTPSIIIDRNLAVDMVCQVPVSEVPIVSAASLGANRRATQMEFSIGLPPADVRADGFDMPHNSLDHVDLVVRGVGSNFSYTTAAAAGAGTNAFHLDPAPSSASPLIWSTRAVDKNGNRSLTSNVTITGFNEDPDEPNGRSNEARPLATPVSGRVETYSPAGDQDWYEVMAKPGDVIDASATATGQDGFNNMDLTMLLLDGSGDLVAYNDDYSGLNPRIVYAVPPPSANSNSKNARKFRILVADYAGSAFAPTAPPQVRTAQTYVLSASVTPTMALAGRFSKEVDPNEFYFANTGPNPANPIAKFLYAIPSRAGKGADVTMRIFDVNGRMVRTLVRGFQEAGPHTAIWDGVDDRGRSVSSGRYFARIQAGTWTSTASVTILK